MRSRVGLPSRQLAFAAAIVALVAAPFVIGAFWVRILSSALMYGALSSAINLIAGYLGYAAFGNVVFFGLGAYTTAIMMLKLGAGFPAGIAASMVLACAFALLFGTPLLRLRGHYFAIATLGLNEVTKALIENWAELAGGGRGLTLPLPPGSVQANGLMFYFLFLALLAIALIATAILLRGRFGYACLAIRIDEDAALSTGIDTTWYKSAAWALSAAITAVAGSLYAYWFSYIEPASVFDMGISVKSFVVFLLGGPGTLLGPAIAALGFEFISVFVWGNLLNIHLGAFGALIVLTVLAMPSGLMPAVRRWFGGKPAPPC